MIRPTVDFPFLTEYKEKFAVTDKTVFACYPDIYTNYPLTPDLLIHEIVHLKQQEEIGLTNWVYDFLEYPEKRLQYELEAYKIQIKSIKDRNEKTRVRYESAKNLSSDLYGNIISYGEALELLK